MDFEEVQQYYAKRYQWHLHQETFQALDESTWISKVTTAFRVAQGEPAESTFYLICNPVTRQQCMIDESALPALTDWCLKMSTKRS